MNARGLFITMEGGEGVGKSTNLAFLERLLTDQGVEVVVTREPGGTLLGEEIRELLLQVRSETVSAEAELLLIFAARAQHIYEVIEPALASGKTVLSDRFTDATYAYQCGGRRLDQQAVEQLEQLVQGDLRPDYTVLLDAPIEVGMVRARDRGELDRIEQETMAFFERVRQAYLQQAKRHSDRYRIIDAAKPLGEVQTSLVNFSSEFLSRWNLSKEEL